MGLIIYPYLLGAIIVFITSVILIIKSALKKDIHLKDSLIGIAISTAIYFLIYIDYKLSDSAYALGTYFMFPFFMIFLPFVIALVIRFSGAKFRRYSQILLITVIFSGIFILIFQKYTFMLIDYLDIPKRY